MNANTLRVWRSDLTQTSSNFPKLPGLGDLAVRYLLVGLVVIFIRGIVTERITAIMWSTRSK